MRIAIVTEVFLPKVDGITNRIHNTIIELAKLGHEVAVFAPDSCVSHHPAAKIFRYASFGFAPYPGVRVALPSLKLVKDLKNFRPDVIHAVGPACLGVWASLIAKFLKIPLLSSYHTDFPQYLPLYRLGWATRFIWQALRKVHNFAQVNLCPSHHTKQELQIHGISNVSLWRGGINTNHFHPNRYCFEMRKRLTSGMPKKPIILYVGRVSHEKSVLDLKHIRETLRHVQIAVVGDGPAMPCLQRVLGHDQVTYTGILRGDELARAYASADLFVMPSRTETLGFVTIEAMSSGLPVIGAGAAGTKELILESNGGLLYDPCFPKNLGTTCKALLEDESLRSSLAKGARNYAASYSWEIASQGLYNQYCRAIEVYGALKEKHAAPQRQLPSSLPTNAAAQYIPADYQA